MEKTGMDKAGNDAAVLEPLIIFLSKWGDELIFAFDDMMAELLYSLDTKKIARAGMGKAA